MKNKPPFLFSESTPTCASPYQKLFFATKTPRHEERIKVIFVTSCLCGKINYVSGFSVPVKKNQYVILNSSNSAV